MNITHHSQLGIVEITKHTKPEEAPNYAKEGGYKGAQLKRVVVVENGTEKGNATVDLVFETEDGQKYVTMVMGSLIHAIKAAVGDIV